MLCDGADDLRAHPPGPHHRTARRLFPGTIEDSLVIEKILTYLNDKAEAAGTGLCQNSEYSHKLACSIDPQKTIQLRLLLSSGLGRTTVGLRARFRYK